MTVGNKGVDYYNWLVTLYWYEQEMAEKVSELRMSESRKKGLKDKWKVTPEYDKKINDMGVTGELAVAKYLNQYFGGTVNTFHSVADVGVNIEVRSSDKRFSPLIVRDNDNEDSYYFLTIKISDNQYYIAGFLYGKDAKNEKYYMSPNKRAMAYFIPQSDLIEPTLENLRKYKLTNL